jgi:pilus assembly protein CpaB
MAVRVAAGPAVFLDEQSPMAARAQALAALGARHRRLVAALCAGAAVLVAVSALTPPPQPATPVSAAGRVRSASPAGALPAAAGGVAPGAAERVAVAVRLADPAGLLLLRVGAHAEVVAGPPADGPAATVPGPAAAPDGEVLAPDAVVLALPTAPDPAGAEGGGGNGAGEERAGGLLSDLGGSGPSGPIGPMTGTAGLDGVVLLAVPPDDARRLAAAATSRSLSVAVGLPRTPSGTP